jgi:type IV pilus assembly protein PilC
MSVYRCTVCNSQGKKIEMLREALNEEYLISSFSSSNDFLIDYVIVENSRSRQIKKRFSNKAVIEFTDIICALLDSKLSIQDSMFMIKDITSDKNVRILSEEIYSELVHGNTLYSALNLFPSTFSFLYRGMVRLSESTGAPSVIFKQLSMYQHKNEEIKTKLKNIFAYPALVLTLVFLGCFGLFIFFIPKMSEILMQFNNDSAIKVVDKLDNLKIYFSVFMATVFILLTVFITIKLLRKKNYSFALLIDRLILRIPVLSNLIKSKQILDFSFAMELLTDAGKTLTESLQEAALSVTNVYFKEAIHTVSKELEKGTALSQAFLTTGVFHPYFITWIKIGEKSGKVEDVFSQIRKYYHSSMEKLTKSILTLIEPGLIIFSGLIIILIIINYILPLFTVYGDVL